MRFNDLTGRRFGMLTVAERVENVGIRVAWRCECDCGGESIVTALNLTSGNSQSCGCMKYKGRKPIANEYREENGYIVGLTPKGEKFLLDKEDLALVKDYCWSKNKEGYLDARPRGQKNGKNLRMHRLIMGLDDSRLDVDHINHDTGDNRKGNLRIATRSQNNMNARTSKNNTSGIPGVVFDKARNKWKAQIGVDYRNIVLGRFDTKEEAIAARKEAEIKYFGEYAFKEVASGGI